MFLGELLLGWLFIPEEKRVVRLLDIHLLRGSVVELLWDLLEVLILVVVLLLVLRHVLFVIVLVVRLGFLWFLNILNKVAVQQLRSHLW